MSSLVDQETSVSGKDVESFPTAENSVEYYLLIIHEEADKSNRLQELEALRKAATSLCHELTRHYIWHGDEFRLELKTEQEITFLYGATYYGDSVEDEWLIVYILRELSKLFPNLWVRVADADGEFLMIEAANAVPKWIHPDIDQNRVWIHQSKLLIIPPPPRHHDTRDASSCAINLGDAVECLKNKTNDLIHSNSIEKEAFHRLEKYPDYIDASMHCSSITVPRKLAFVLHMLPKTIAKAVEAFYLRDAFSLKPIMSANRTLTFPPKDLVTTGIQFNRVLFAQLKSQRFAPPPSWQSLFPATSGTSPSGIENSPFAQLEMGMKLTCGFEMLAEKAGMSRHRVVREMDILLHDLAEDGDDVLPTDTEMESWPNHHRNDDERWMEISYEDLDRELGGQGGLGSKESTGFGDAHVQDNLRKIVARFETFLDDDKAGLEGVDFDENEKDDDEDMSNEGSDSEDQVVNLDDESFTQTIKKLIGMPEINEGKKGLSVRPGLAEQGNRPTLDGLNDSDDGLRQLTLQLEAELTQHGALNLGSDPNQPHRLAGQAQAREKERRPTTTSVPEDAEEEIDIDYNLARNILESFKGQAGMAGPASNLLGMMGMTLPRDEDDNAD